MLKRHLMVGAVCFLGFAAAEAPHISAAETFVLLSVLFFVPAVFRFAFRPSKTLENVLLRCYPIAALCAVLALITDFSFFAFVWLIYTLGLALYAVWRLMKTNIHRAEEMSVMMGFVYLAGGGFWFFAYILKIPIMDFGPLIVLLTAVHFHYSAFLIPIFNGLLGRILRENRVLYRLSTVIILISPILIALGITFSKILDVIAVALYLTGLYVNAYLVFKASFAVKTGRFLIRSSSAVLMITIAFSLIYSLGVYREEATLTISQMIWIHGAVNAFGVILPALAGWRLENPRPFDEGSERTFSRIYGKGTIGKNFLTDIHAANEIHYTGLQDQMRELHSEDFSTEKLAPAVISFYEETIDYDIKAKVTWSGWFRPFARMYEPFSRRAGQIHLSMNPDWYTMHTSMKGVDSDRDGRKNVRAWIRTNDKQETVFTALYSAYRSKGEGYMNISLPLPYGQMTGILKPYTHKQNLVLTSRRRKSGAGDEGIYLQTKWGACHLPLAETFLIAARSETSLKAVHHMWLFGLKFLTVRYRITHTSTGKQSK
ncbi:YndJ family protein [Bacillus siamensis]|uniref:YndJ family protein n=1 Tax=Bacillus siamensis TaxID=659243 RepID=UPI0028FE2D07|nr:YndJ family transporter [Bacillus siamensis]MDU0812662.1 YndJ family transporter [Bacillus siamensis]